MSEQPQDEEPEQLWEQGWEGHQQAQAERMALWPMWEKLKWLEEAHLLVLQLQKQQAGTCEKAASNDEASDAATT